MCSKTSFVACAAAVALLAGPVVALAKDNSDKDDTAPNAHQTELDQEYARTHPTVMPGTSPTISAPYGYVPPHRLIRRHR